MGGRQNKEVDKQLEYITNQVKLAVFDEPLLKDEEKTIATGIVLFKRISTVSMLAFRPALLVKELSLGLLKNFTLAGVSVGNEYNLANVTKAYSKLVSTDKRLINEFDVNQKLNDVYRIANMDIATVSKKLQHDKAGIARGFGR